LRPPQVTCSLTELGESLAEPLCGLLVWSGAHTDALIEAQRRHDEQAGQAPGSGLTAAGAPAQL
jgi:DNA-binding HxlR family transcriptional regulator